MFYMKANILQEFFICISVPLITLKISISSFYMVKNQKQPPEVFCKKGVLKTFAKLTGKHLCQSLFFNKVIGLMSATLLKKRLWYRCFLVNFVKFLRTPFLQNTSGRLLLENLCEISIQDNPTLQYSWKSPYFYVDPLIY